jgi:hypothetical protein
MAVLAALMGASAGYGTRCGRLAVLAAAAALVLTLSMLVTAFPAWFSTLAPSLWFPVSILLVGVYCFLRAPRRDTRMIAMLLGFSALLPIALYFYTLPD